MRKALGALTLISAGILAATQPGLAQTTQADIPVNPSGPIPVPSTGDSGLVLSVWSPTLPLSLVYYTGLTYSQVQLNDLTPETGLTLDFGFIPGWDLFAGNTSDLQYHLLATDGFGPLGQNGTATTAALGLGTFIANNGDQQSIQGTNGAGNFFAQVNMSCQTTNPCLYNANDPELVSRPDADDRFWGPRYNGALSVNASGTVGTPLGFYFLDPTGANTTQPANVFQYENAAGLGQWLLTEAGHLTYSIAGMPSAVPLPAAVWLLLSGIAGFGAVSRRRNAA